MVGDRSLVQWTRRSIVRFFTELPWRFVYFAATLVRVALILYGEWQDANMAVKYTDIDYVVFTDAARFVTEGESPYLRSTYRYTPLLAYMLTPNVALHPAFGKAVFAASDVVIGALLHMMLAHVAASAPSRLSGAQVKMFVCVWLFNPIAVNVSTRGNAEAIISLQVLACLFLLQRGHEVAAAVLYGLSVHTKIYPIIFAPALYFHLDSTHHGRPTNLVGLFTRRRVVFTLVSAGTYLALTGGMYLVYGFEFLWETYLYHVVRKDHRHNFSPYFYYLYLQASAPETLASRITGIVAFLPQVLLLLVLSLVYYRDLWFCLFVQTLTWVTFNKVCTVQYFIWYFSLLPLVLPSSRMPASVGSFLFISWLLSQGLWLYTAYELEFLGLNTFVGLSVSSGLFLLINVYSIVCFIHYNRGFRFTSSEVAEVPSKKKT